MPAVLAFPASVSLGVALPVSGLSDRQVVSDDRASLDVCAVYRVPQNPSWFGAGTHCQVLDSPGEAILSAVVAHGLPVVEPDAKVLLRLDGQQARRLAGGDVLAVDDQRHRAIRRKTGLDAQAAGVPVRTLQEFLSQHRWQEDLSRDRLQQIVAEEHAHPHSVGIIDETSFVKRGSKTPGVQRQYLGTVGKQENGIVSVHLAYAADDFHCLLDGELFLPESWANDPVRCREAKIPETIAYRPKTEIALELYDRARANGIQFAWLTFDEWYGGKPACKGRTICRGRVGT